MNYVNLNVLHKNNFDLLRLIFASMVVFFHIGTLTQQSEFSWMTNISGTFAVQAFFVVSGYLVTMSCEKTASLVDYAKKRLLRIAPAYIFIVVGAAVFLSMMSTLTPTEYFRSEGFWRYIVMNLALANFSAPSLPGVFSENYISAVNVSLWTIKVEILFYSVTPLIVYAVRRLGYKTVLPLVLVLSIVWLTGFSFLGDYTGNEFYHKLSKQLPGQMAYFAGGAWVYYASRQNSLPPIWLAVAGAVFYFFASGTLFYIVAPIAVAAVVGWAALSAPHLGQFGKHGDFSYGIYLFHAPTIQTIIALGYFSSLPQQGLFLTLGLVTIAGVFSWNFIEKPFLSRRAK